MPQRAKSRARVGSPPPYPASRRWQDLAVRGRTLQALGLPTEPQRSLTRDMGSVLAVANQKGGVGKTTTAVNLGASISDVGYPTLLVDLDPQCNATLALGLPKDAEPNVYGCLSGELTLPEAARPSGVENLDVVPSTPALAGANVELPRIAGSETTLRERLGGVRERYLFTLLDCPPSLGPLTVNALVAADKVIVPVQTEYFALEGLALLLDTLSLIQCELNPRLTVAGMILTMHDGRTRLARHLVPAGRAAAWGAPSPPSSRAATAPARACARFRLTSSGRIRASRAAGSTRRRSRSLPSRSGRADCSSRSSCAPV